MICAQGLTFSKVNTFYCLIKVIVKWNWYFKKNPGLCGSAIYTGCYSLVPLPQLVLRPSIVFILPLLHQCKCKHSENTNNVLILQWTCRSIQRPPESVDSTLRITGTRNALKGGQRRVRVFFLKQLLQEYTGWYRAV